GLSQGVVRFICLFAGQPSNLLSRSVLAAKKGSAERQISQSPYDEGFVINDQEGRVACRDATPEEARAMRRRDPAQQLRVITPLTRDLQQQQAGLKIILRGTPQLDSFPAATHPFVRPPPKCEPI